MRRFKALTRRPYRNDTPIADCLIFNDGDLKVNIPKLQVKKKKTTVNLTPNEFNVLNILLTNPNQVFIIEKLVVKALVEAHEGKIEVENEPGKGTSLVPVIFLNTPSYYLHNCKLN